MEVHEMRRFRNILCVIERAAESQPALHRAVEMAENNQASLLVVVVRPRLPVGISLVESGPSSDQLQTTVVQDYEAWLEHVIEPYRQRVDIEFKVLLGTSFLEIIREVLRNEHDLVIKCPESPNWLNRLFAGDDMHLLRKCPCPVWFIKPQASMGYSRILAAVDVDALHPPRDLKTRHQLNVQIVELAASLSLSESAELHIVHAWEAMSELIDGFVFSPDVSKEQLATNVDLERRQQQRQLDQLMQDVRTNNNAARDALDYLKPRTHLVKGLARKEIPALAKQLAVDCIVMGTVARTGIRGFIMGNTAETILEQIDCSVLAVKPEGFETPVTLDD